jgi:V/A-type H+-transporting ATPase subunit I
MQKIRIIALESVRYGLIKALQNTGVMEIRKSPLPLADDAPSASLPEISDQVIRMKSALALFAAPKSAKSARIEAKKQHFELPQLLKEAQGLKVVDELFKLSEEKKELAGKLEELEDALNVAELLTGVGINFDRLKSSVLEFRAFVIEGKGPEVVKEALSEKGIRHELITKKLKGNRLLVFMAFDKNQGSLIEEALKGARPEELNISDKLLTSTPEEVAKRLRAEHGVMAKRLNEINERLKGITQNTRGGYYLQIASLAEMLDVEYERANISAQFKKTGKTFVIEGWVPKNKLTELNKAIKGAIGEGFQMEEINDGEFAPTLVNRPKILQPFDYLVEFFSLPRSDEIDPTYMLIITLAISYGIMVSDVGYGIMSFILSWFIIRKTDPDGLLNNVARIWQLFSVPIIIFGLLSNEFLGFSFAPFKGIQLFDWINGVPSLILVTIMLGIFEIALGLFLGFINKYQHHERKLAAAKIFSIFALVFGTIAIGGGLFSAFGYTLTLASAVIAALSFLLAAVLSGIEAAELPALIAHPLSYSRLLGFGLASVILSFLIDKAFTPTLSHGILLYIVFLVIFIVLHTINMILSIFEGIVQGARLNFVEFFSKFYMGSGVKFRPYYFKRRYTKEQR